MTPSEADRLDLYNGLSEVLGPTRAETLMTFLPDVDPSELASKTDMSSIREDISALRADIHDLRSDLKTGLEAVNARIDRLFLTLVAGLFVIVAAMAGVVVSLR